MNKYRILTADYVYSGLGKPLKDGALMLQEFANGGVIIAIDKPEKLREFYPEIEPEYVGFAISPQPVNAHTHLDLSKMPYSPGEYSEFIMKALDFVASGKRTLESSLAGLKELEKNRTKVIGDIVTDKETMKYLLSSDLQGVAFWEVIDPNPETAEQSFNRVVEELREFRKLEKPSGVRVGISPRTPHTVSAPLLQKLAALSKQNDIPLQIHVAESPQEIRLHMSGDGPLMELPIAYKGWQATGKTPVQYLKELGVLEAKPSLVHMVNVTEEDVKDVAKSGSTVVHCPRSNIALQCGRFPFELYVKHGVDVAIGTDSRGSSPSLSVEDEVMAARELHGNKVSDESLLWSAVKGGYRGLGLKTPKLGKGTSTEMMYIWSGKKT